MYVEKLKLLRLASGITNNIQQCKDNYIMCTKKEKYIFTVTLPFFTN